MKFPGRKLKDLNTYHRILIVLTLMIVLNITIFIVKDYHPTFSIRQIILKSYNNFYIFKNASTIKNGIHLSFGTQQKDSGVLSEAVLNATSSDFRTFCNLSVSGGVSGCTKPFKTYYDKYMQRCSAHKQEGNQTLCSCFPNTLVGWEKQAVTLPVKNSSQFTLDPKPLGILPGGRWKPNHCTPRQRVAIIVPYRDREEHLKIFSHRMHHFMMHQQHDYQIFIIEQNKPKVFSRAVLMNVGFLEANKFNFDCFIFSDIDLLPEDDRSMYDCTFSPLHLGAYVSKFKYKVLYDTIFGGISALSKEHVLKTNLFSNRFYGWGGEDDDLFRRLQSASLTLYRYPQDIGRVFMIVHKRDVSNKNNPLSSDGTVQYARKAYLSDGVAQTRYEVVKTDLRPLYTLVTVNLLPTAQKKECIIKKGENVTQTNYLTCWGDANFRSGKIDCCRRQSHVYCCHKRPMVVKPTKKRIVKLA